MVFLIRSLSKEGHFSLRIQNPQDSLFYESEFEKFQTLGPIDITIVLKNSSHEESLLLLTGLQVPISINLWWSSSVGRATES